MSALISNLVFHQILGMIKLVQIQRRYHIIMTYLIYIVNHAVNKICETNFNDNIFKYSGGANSEMIKYPDHLELTSNESDWLKIFFDPYNV